MSWLEKRKDVGTGAERGEVLDIGDYVFEITKAELVQNKNKNGRYLDLEHTVISDHSKGRKVFTRWNVEHPNPTAERIGLERVNQIIEFGGMDAEPESEKDMLGVMIGGRITVREDPGYDPDCQVSYYKRPDSCNLESYTKFTPGADASKAAGGGKKSFAERSSESASDKTAETAATTTAKKPWEK